MITHPAGTVTAPPDQAAPVGATHLRHIMVALAVVVASLGSWTLVSQVLATDATPAGLGPMESVDQSSFAGETGIWIEHVTLLGGGGLIQIRYRILDLDKAVIVHDTVNPPKLITHDGIELQLQRHEHSHERDDRLGQTYDEQLFNLGGQVRAGDRVTIVFGTFDLEGVLVQ